MTKVSVLVPTRNEHPELLQKTIDDLFAKASDEIEVVVGFDGPPYTSLAERPGLTRVFLPPGGLRATMNVLGELATGEFLFKVDAHCMFQDGYDVTLKQECDVDWVVVPRMYELNWSIWEPYRDRMVDYYYLSCPWNHPKFFQMQSCFWLSKTQRLSAERPLDDIMAFQGSAWFMPTRYWRETLQGVAGPEVFGPYAEHQEISLKTWLGGGQVKVNKNTWYAHEHRTNRRRGYHREISEFHRSHINIARYFALNQWPERAHDFEWLVEKFSPLPHQSELVRGEVFEWPEDWRATVRQPEPVTPFSHYFPVRP